MKKQLVLYIFFLNAVFAFGQTQDDTLLRNDNYFSINSVFNEEWKNESAVILAQKTVLIIEKEEDAKATNNLQFATAPGAEQTLQSNAISGIAGTC